MSQYLTQQDVTNYGEDLVDFSQRVALHAVAPHLRNLGEQNAELQRRLAREARYSLDQRVEQAVPNFREIDSNPEWHRWLLTVDSLSGQVRQQLLNDAIASGDASRIAAFFRSFLRETGASGHASPRASGHASTSYDARRTSPGGRVYTTEEIKRLYRQHQQGAYRGREAEWARQEADIFRAQHEGRVLGGKDVSGK